MKDLIDVVNENLPEIVRKKPLDTEAAFKESVVDKAIFDYYAKLYRAHPEYTKQQYISKVAEQFNKSHQQVAQMYSQFRWYTRGKAALSRDTVMPVDASNAVNELLGDAYLISKLGTRLISDYIVSAKPELMQAKDIFKLGMLVVECIRVTNEVNTGTGKTGNQQGQVINLVINE